MSGHEESLLLERDLDALLDLSQSLIDTTEIEQSLQRTTRRMAEALGCDRCSIVLLDEAARAAFIVVASDDPELTNFPLELESYPELEEVLRTEAPLIIDDIERATLFDGVREQIRAKRLGSTILFPVRVDRRVHGVIHLRKDTARVERLTARELRFGRIVANATGIAIKNARLFETVRDQSERRLSERLKAERRLRQIEKYQRFFDFAGDGLMIVNGAGRILFANRAAEAILGFDGSALSQLTLADIADGGISGALEEVLAAIRESRYRRDMDLPVVRASGECAVLSLTTAALGEPGETGDLPAIADERSGERPQGDVAAIVSFRDITESRRLEAELRRTKDFLANLVESSVDAIVASDMQGRILVFNEAAATITGYASEEALGSSVVSLYPRGVAKEIMVELRSEENGGRGKLRGRRQHLLTKGGELVPVSLRAGVLYEDGREIATVGIFSDLRERLRMEEELEEAQERLVLTERQAAMVELAGAAAHELNQPLTSVIGYAELLQRKVAPDAGLAGPLSTVLSESLRMAEIVRKLGHITRYRTKAYVGGTEIVDLDAASQEEGDG